ncbi:transposase IS4 family (plasmid) [Cupriavidus necator N-1]|uniref:Transposase IS4 family n=1 Tax=Cupriavidus necator (strain ATCC 43291 / DSM 13513 / CCUG 52238 / LMG 8453 / N-1) TaxID=1042878 RepID=F8GUY7_CUPNN|nr:transposase IS4 family [Cupriavidus necator N-1]
MRGADTFTESLFTMRRLEDFVPQSHPLRPVRTMVIKGGRPSIAPEKLLRAMLLQVLYSIRSERQLMEQTQYNLLFRWRGMSTARGIGSWDGAWNPRWRWNGCRPKRLPAPSHRRVHL